MTEQELIDKINSQVDSNIEKYTQLLDLANEIKSSITTDYVPLKTLSDKSYQGIGLHTITISATSRYFDMYVFDTSGNLLRSILELPTALFNASGTRTSMYIPVLVNGSVTNAVSFTSTNRGKIEILSNNYRVRLVEYGK